MLRHFRISLYPFNWPIGGMQIGISLSLTPSFLTRAEISNNNRATVIYFNRSFFRSGLVFRGSLTMILFHLLLRRSRLLIFKLPLSNMGGLLIVTDINSTDPPLTRFDSRFVRATFISCELPSEIPFPSPPLLFAVDISIFQIIVAGEPFSPSRRAQVFICSGMIDFVRLPRSLKTPGVRRPRTPRSPVPLPSAFSVRFPFHPVLESRLGSRIALFF